MQNEEYYLLLKKIQKTTDQDEIDKYENLISKDMYCAYQYAVHTKKRFLKGEKEISKSASLSFLYAKEIIRDRFLEGEREIFKDINMCYDYVTNVVKKPINEVHVELLNSKLEKKYADFLINNGHKELVLEYLI
jgi:hypothetical protein